MVPIALIMFVSAEFIVSNYGIGDLMFISEI